MATRSESTGEHRRSCDRSRPSATAVARVAACTALLLGSGPVALANGRFPRASQIAFDPSHPEHLVVNTTFGLLETRDRGRTFAWSCELALGLAGDVDPMLAIASTGAIVAATYIGVVTTVDGCAFHTVPELGGEIVPDITFSAALPHRLLAFRSIGLGDERYDAEVLRSVDDGAHWERLAPLPRELMPLTIDGAPSDGERVYLSARLGAAADYASVLLRSDDGGASFEQNSVPETSGQRMAYIGAVDPSDRDRVYVRVDDPAGTALWVTRDAGRTWEKAWNGVGSLLGMALSPDGAEIAVGGPMDGLWVGSRDGGDFARRSDLSPSCLAWNEDGLYACADASQAGFSVGRSRDGGATFRALFDFADLCGPRACPSDTSAGRVCALQWEALAPAIGSTCLADAGPQNADAGRDGRPSDATSASNDAASDAPNASDRDATLTGPVTPSAAGGCQMGRAGTGAMTPPAITWIGRAMAWGALLAFSRRAARVHRRRSLVRATWSRAQGPRCATGD